MPGSKAQRNPTSREFQDPAGDPAAGETSSVTPPDATVAATRPVPDQGDDGGATPPGTYEALDSAFVHLESLCASGTADQIVFDDMVRVVARSMRVPLCKLLELPRNDTSFIVRAGFGWGAGVVGHARVSAREDSQPGYALSSGGPVVFDDLPHTSRFRGAELARRHGVISSVCVPVFVGRAPFGVLCVHDLRRREFVGEELEFLRRVAKLLSARVARRWRAEA